MMLSTKRARPSSSDGCVADRDRDDTNRGNHDIPQPGHSFLEALRIRRAAYLRSDRPSVVASELIQTKSREEVAEFVQIVESSAPSALPNTARSARIPSGALPWDEAEPDLLAASDDSDDELTLDDILASTSSDSPSYRHLQRTHDILATIRARCPIGLRKANAEPPSKIRRTERPNRVRLHVHCHKCDSKLGSDNMCTCCGHVRCRACQRTPVDGVRTPRVEACMRTRGQRDQKVDQSADRDASLALPGTPSPLCCASQTVAKPALAAAVPRRPQTLVTQTLQLLKSAEPTDTSLCWMPSTSAPLAMDPIIADEQEDDQPPCPSFRLTRNARYTPRSSVNFTFKSATESTRRHCHECKSQFPPSNRTDCQSCGHIRCSLCPLSKVDDSDDYPCEYPRVYREIRHIVRFTCDQCQHVNAARHVRCQECGHNRCDGCQRDPPRRPAETFDDSRTFLTSADRIAAHAQRAAMTAVT